MLMENIETYWAIANKTIAIINILIEGWLVYRFVKYSLQGTTQGRYLTGGVPPVRFSM